MLISFHQSDSTAARPSFAASAFFPSGNRVRYSLYACGVCSLVAFFHMTASLEIISLLISSSLSEVNPLERNSFIVIIPSLRYLTIVFTGTMLHFNSILFFLSSIGLILRLAFQRYNYCHLQLMRYPLVLQAMVVL